MKIESLKDMEEFIKLCRRLGVLEATVDGIKLSLGEAPKRTRKAKDTSSSEIDNQAAPTEEELLYWSVTNG